MKKVSSRYDEKLLLRMPETRSPTLGNKGSLIIQLWHSATAPREYKPVEFRPTWCDLSPAVLLILINYLTQKGKKTMWFWSNRKIRAARAHVHVVDVYITYC